jgi:UDP-N-acetylglucosamine acyltransferase
LGIKRAGLGTDGLNAIKTMYRLLFHENLTVEDAIQRILNEVPASPQRQEFVEFLKSSERGVCR